MTRRLGQSVFLRYSALINIWIRFAAVQAKCYFPAEYQGVYLTQSLRSPNSGIQYSEVTILPDSIPVWGNCRTKMGNNIILLDKSGALDCIRCFHFLLRSGNILEVHTESLEKCYTVENAAVASCPQDHSNNAISEAENFMLYKIKQLNEISEVPVVKNACPINGKFSLTYSLNDGLENILYCSNSYSTVNNCPEGYKLNIKFQKCPFGNVDISFLCLGSWKTESSTDEINMAFLDESVVENGDRRPRYRCGKMIADDKRGRIFVALSSDSTCHTDLISPYRGFETLVLTRINDEIWPTEEDEFRCIFPDWIQGLWEDFDVRNGTLSYIRRKYYSMPTMNLCEEENFQEHRWITKGRANPRRESPCPVAGEYTGFIPNTPGLCAKLSSDCNNPQIMFFTIFNCYNRSEIYEDREYRCLGQWTDDDLVYTYTQRGDVDGYECFVGTKKEGENEIFIAEAGSNCERGKRPYFKGMKLLRKAACYYQQIEGVPGVAILQDERTIYHIPFPWTEIQKGGGATINIFYAEKFILFQIILVKSISAFYFIKIL